jgi:hypothetical protein
MLSSGTAGAAAESMAGIRMGACVVSPSCAARPSSASEEEKEAMCVRR